MQHFSFTELKKKNTAPIRVQISGKLSRADLVTCWFTAVEKVLNKIEMFPRTSGKNLTGIF